MENTRIKEVISALESIRNPDNATSINNAIACIRSLNEDHRIMTDAYTGCATRLQQSTMENYKLKEKLATLSKE